MFTREDVNHIQKIAAPIGNSPSKHLMEFLVEQASAEDCTVEELCLIIDCCAQGGKLANAQDEQANTERAKLFKALMCRFSKDTVEDRKKRATALRYVSRLRGKPYEEYCPKQEERTDAKSTDA